VEGVSNDVGLEGVESPSGDGVVFRCVLSKRSAMGSEIEEVGESGN
jgi:hypothetical protein